MYKRSRSSVAKFQINLPSSLLLVTYPSTFVCPLNVFSLKIIMNFDHEFVTTAARIALNSAEEYFKIGLFDAAIRSAEAAKNLNSELTSMADNFITAYRVHLISSSSASNNKGSASLYEVLGIGDVKASVDVIRRQYKRMALLLHPDKNPSIASEAAFKIVRQASDVLTDETKRWSYDCKNGFRSSVAKQTPQNPFKRANGKEPAADDHQKRAKQSTAKPRSSSYSHNNQSSYSSSSFKATRSNSRPSSRTTSPAATPPPAGFGSGCWVGINLESLAPGASIRFTIKRSCRTGQRSVTINNGYSSGAVGSF